jgi:putative transposase
MNGGVGNISELQRLEKEKRNDYIRKIKKIEGVTVRQIARVTGISKSVIGRV